MKWLKLLQQNPPWLTASFEGAASSEEREGNHTHASKWEDRCLGRNLPLRFSFTFPALSRGYSHAAGMPTVWDKVTMQLWGCCSTEFSSAHGGSGTVLSALHNPRVLNPHVEGDTLSILIFHLGK